MTSDPGWQPVETIPWPVYEALSRGLRQAAHDAANMAVAGLAATEIAAEQTDNPKQKRRLDRASRQFERMSALINAMREDAYRDRTTGDNPGDAIRSAVEKAARESGAQIGWEGTVRGSGWVEIVGASVVAHVAQCLVRHIATSSGAPVDKVTVVVFSGEGSAGVEVHAEGDTDGADNSSDHPSFSGPLGITLNVAATMAARHGGRVQRSSDTATCAVQAIWPAGHTADSAPSSTDKTAG